MKRMTLTLSIVFLIIVIAFSANTKQKNEGYCEEGSSLQVTAEAFSVSLNNLDMLLDEGVLKVELLYNIEDRKKTLADIDNSKYYVDDYGVFRNTYSKNKSSAFATGFIDIDSDLKDTMIATEHLDDFFKKCLEDYSFLTQAYYIEYRSFSRVYPAFHYRSELVANDNLTEFNFFKEIDQDNRKANFITKPYIDPAGRGWVISFVKAVIVDGELKGALGVDVEVEKLNEMLILSGGTLIVNESGDIISLSDDMYQQIGLRVLPKHKYLSSVEKTIYLPDTYNINNSKINALREIWTNIKGGELAGKVNFNGELEKYCSFQVDGYSIYLIHIK